MDMEDDILGDDLPISLKHLFERLAQVPNYTWDLARKPFHSTYEHWHVFGIQHHAESEVPSSTTSVAYTTRSSGSNRSSPKLNARPHARQHWSSISGASTESGFSSRPEPEQLWTPIVARISTHGLRVEREFNYHKSIVQDCDPNYEHSLKAMDLFRLPYIPADTTPMVACIYENIGPNYLQQLVDMGPAFFRANSLHADDDHTPTEQLPLQAFLDFSIGACECLELLHHGAHAVHGEIRQDTFHWAKETGKVKLANRGNGPRAFENLLSSEGWASLSKEVGVKIKLSFIAPEQTGRLLAEPDSRTDIYSLGVLFWTILMGRAAFDGDTPIEIIQKVLSSRLPPVSTKRIDLPDTLSHIIAKMTHKQMSERYHSVNGLKHDLTQIQKFLSEGEQNKLQEFKIAQKDVSSFFDLPSTLVGRDAEREKIHKIVDRVYKQNISAKGRTLQSLYTAASGSSVSEAGGHGLDPIDGSDSSSSIGNRDSASNSTALGRELTHASARSNIHSVGRMLPDPRSSLEVSDRDSSMSGNISIPSADHLSVMSRRRNSHKFKKFGKTEVILLTGSQGVGKTALLKAVQPHIRRHGYLASTTFDRAKPNPFERLLSVMASLFRQIFSEKDITTPYHEMVRSHTRPIWTGLHQLLGLPESLIDTDATYKTSTMAPDAHTASVRTDLTNNDQNTKSATALGGTWDANDFLRGPANTKTIRLMNTFIDVLRVMSSGKLICFCLDDMHAAEDESLDLTSNIIKAKIPVLFLLASRPEYHRDMPEKLRSLMNHETTNKIELGSLRERHTFEYVAATMSQNVEAILPLAAVVHEKSRGNPFMMREILQNCYRTECLWYDWRSSAWQFDLDKIFNELSSEGDLDNSYLTRKLSSLGPAPRSILAWASLIGHSFCFKLVQRILSGDFFFASPSKNGAIEDDAACSVRAQKMQLSEADCVDGLQQLLSLGILVATDADYEFRFSHARYLRAANEMQECRNVAKMHFVLAQAMLLDVCSNKDTLYTLCRHICLSVDLFKERVPVRVRVRDALWTGAKQAIESGAISTALWYYQTCLALLQDRKWDIDQTDVFYDETLQVHINTAELLVTSGKFDEASVLISETFEHARCSADKTRSYLLSGKVLSRKGLYDDAFNELKKCLTELGVSMTPTSWDECDIEFKRLEYRIRNMDRSVFLSRKLSDEKAVIALGTIFSEAMSAAYWYDTVLWYQLVLKYVTALLDRGTFAQAGIGFTMLGVAAIGRFKDLELGLMYGEIAQDFYQIYDDSWTRGRGWTLYVMFLSHFHVPIRDVLPILDGALEYSLTSGDHVISILNLGAMAAFRFWSGHDLAEIEAFCHYAPEEFEGWELDTRGGTLLIAVRQLVKALQGKTMIGSAETVLDDDHHTRSAWASMCERSRANVQRSVDIYTGITAPVYFVYGYHEYLVNIGRKMVQTSLDELWTNRPVAHLRFYLGLALLQVARTKTGAERDALVAEATEMKHFIDSWSTVNDVNYAAWSHILAADIGSVHGDWQVAFTNSEMAIDHCSVHGFAFEEAIAVELQAESIIARGGKRVAKSMVQEAIAAWNRINASGKAKQLAEKHEWLLKTAVTSRTMDSAVQTIDIGNIVNHDDPGMHAQREYTKAWIDPKPSLSTGAQDVPGLGLDVLDLTSILEFSRVISSELQLSGLLKKMTGVIMESVGGQAEFCAVVIDSANQGWCVVASSDHESGVKTYEPGIPFTDVDDQVAQHTINYSLRTKETVFVPNVLEDDRFSNVSEAYVQRNPAGRSIICMPVLQADHLMGVIHLEGRPNAFTQRNMIVLNLLTSQVSISLGNALLYRKVRKVSAANAAMVESQKLALAAAREAEAKAKKAEAEAKENVKLKEEAAKAKSIFLANVSHELRTPLNGVIGMSELLKGTPLSKDQDGYADSIRVCADTLLTVINDILDFSKLEAGKMQMFTVAINLKETITEVVRALAYTNQEHGLETIEDLNLDNNLVLGDPVRLHQIFMNLLSNAYKFTAKGSVTVKAERIAEDKDKIKVKCSVTDTGIGITEEQLTRLFQPFSQADSSTARSYGGSGLGLSICKAMIENVLGGKIWIESTPDVGTAVYFTLTFQKAPKDSTIAQDMKISAKDPDPMANWSQSTTPQSEEPRLSLIDLSKISRDELRVCIAEDNAINRKIAISFVGKLGLKCEAYEDGKLAWEALQKRSKEGNPFHIVLMDVQMPVLDGYEATKAIRADPDPNVSRVLVIAMTASAIRGDREKCLEAGMNDYLAKPVRQTALKAMLDEYLNNTRSANSALRRGSTPAITPGDKVNGKKDADNDRSTQNGTRAAAEHPKPKSDQQETTKPNPKRNRLATRDAQNKENDKPDGKVIAPSLRTETSSPPSGKKIMDQNGHVSSDIIPPKDSLQSHGDSDSADSTS